ncbi:Histidine kinase [Lentibacillus sp. JNUCC-1]|uniref:hypothetical protein n=1 Tax=Lentibacillus sp. JNUCC-1 TaxID=2654513 RepID=UPI0013225937|nr:Histidine kinase [Lentibacillus sp. JNUCC-1]
MSTLIRHILTAILFTLIMSLMIAGTVLAAFPPDDWALVLHKTLYDIPLLVYLGDSL